GAPVCSEPGPPRDEVGAPPAAERRFEAGEQLLELPFTADESRSSLRGGSWARRWKGARRILSQDRLLELTQLPPRFDSQLLDERAPCFLVGGERLRLATGAIQG